MMTFSRSLVGQCLFVDLPFDRTHSNHKRMVDPVKREVDLRSICGSHALDPLNLLADRRSGLGSTIICHPAFVLLSFSAFRALVGEYTADCLGTVFLFRKMGSALSCRLLLTLEARRSLPEAVEEGADDMARQMKRVLKSGSNIKRKCCFRPVTERTTTAANKANGYIEADERSIIYRG
jgi:hypothetical protein